MNCWKSIAMASVVFCATLAFAETVSIDFEDVSDLTYVSGYRTKSGSITQTTDIPSGSTGTYAANFTWYTDGTYTNQYAYMVKSYAEGMDFTNASLSFWHKRYNRSNVVGLALYDDGELVSQWDWAASTGWAELSVEVGVTAPTTTGIGDIASVDEIRFMNKWTTGGSSGVSCTIYYDDFVATNVNVPEPATMVLLATGCGAFFIKRRK